MNKSHNLVTCLPATSSNLSFQQTSQLLLEKISLCVYFKIAYCYFWKLLRLYFFFWIITVWIINNAQNYWESSFGLLWWVKSINTLGDTQWFHKLHPIKVRLHICFSTNMFTHRIFKWGCECWIGDTLHLKSALRGQNTSTSVSSHGHKSLQQEHRLQYLHSMNEHTMGLGTCWVITTVAMVPASHKWASILNLFFLLLPWLNWSQRAFWSSPSAQWGGVLLLFSC